MLGTGISEAAKWWCRFLRGSSNSTAVMDAEVDISSTFAEELVVLTVGTDSGLIELLVALVDTECEEWMDCEALFFGLFFRFVVPVTTALLVAAAVVDALMVEIGVSSIFFRLPLPLLLPPPPPIALIECEVLYLRH